MPGEPTMWALTEAERALDHAMALSTPDHNRLRVAIARALDAAHTDAFFAGAEAMRVAVEARSPAGPTLAALLVDRIDESDLLTAYLATKEPA